MIVCHQLNPLCSTALRNGIEDHPAGHVNNVVKSAKEKNMAAAREHEARLMHIYIADQIVFTLF